ncbi:hypothetical protein D9619_002418 [Psilocybe cf. subviscida]|uniref:T6SS Phospholipase effector Tle1-like catalytic domain-containing protein n=1 Tax=Psilocybe cf. subviscida TaxID=2480587 RepID=A0A8H5AYI2_9AGAR|nr:hypothetical protein D9619_002418 [Psilocybe cf. subviscida]
MPQPKKTLSLSLDEEQNMPGTTEYNEKDLYPDIPKTMSPGLDTSFSVSDDSTQQSPTQEKGRGGNGHAHGHTTHHNGYTYGHHIHGRTLSTNTDASTLRSPPTIPPTHSHRTLILCFDGTGDQFDDDNSNIVNFFSMLKKDSPAQQMVYYQAGIGTYTIPQIAKPMMAKLHKVMDSMVGVHLNAHVMGGYEFLMQNYEAGDKIFLFGFSRGAYTARALAGMIHKVGLLPKDNHQQVPFAYKMYSREDEIGWRQSSAFKKAFSIDVDIELLGVWETVGSVGVIPKRLPFTTFNTHVKNFRHALALDEHRVRFKPNFFNRPTQEEMELGLKWGEMQRESDKARLEREKLRQKPHRRKTMRELERQYNNHGGQHYTDVEEVWFSGCHCDVGGGAVRNEIRNNLARISLRWMVRECFRLKTGILFHQEAFAVIGMDHSTLWPQVKPRPPPVTTFSKGHPPPLIRPLHTMGINHTAGADDDFVNEEEEDLADALSPINDMLEIAKSWWIMELIPQQIRFQTDEDSWVRKLSINRGRGRVVPKQRYDGVKLHRTVKIKMETPDEDGKKYTPKAKLIKTLVPTWID